ncbi:hypothetical protein BC828DRAFT_392033 [Blastocladiella britannica]|nr:hypothetical protein BC828DRAFT_392033 [Blastocladiella britannica]
MHNPVSGPVVAAIVVVATVALAALGYVMYSRRWQRRRRRRTQHADPSLPPPVINENCNIPGSPQIPSPSIEPGPVLPPMPSHLAQSSTLIHGLGITPSAPPAADIAQHLLLTRAQSYTGPISSNMSRSPSGVDLGTMGGVPEQMAAAASLFGTGSSPPTSTGGSMSRSSSKVFAYKDREFRITPPASDPGEPEKSVTTVVDSVQQTQRDHRRVFGGVGARREDGGRMGSEHSAV